MCDLLKLEFPTSAAGICFVQAGFCNISSNVVLAGCVGTTDGLFVVTKRPSMTTSDSSPTSYFSGHCYYSHGLNVQAIYDSSYCIMSLLLLHREGLQNKLLWSKILCQLH